MNNAFQYALQKDDSARRARLARCVGPGWRALIEKLIDDLFEAGWNGDVRQVKEKFAGLRFYIGEGSDQIHKLVENAESASEHICEACGAPGEREVVNDGLWLKTLCAEHLQLSEVDKDAYYKLMND